MKSSYVTVARVAHVALSATAAVLAFVCVPACAPEAEEIDPPENMASDIVGGTNDGGHIGVVRIAYDADAQTNFCTGSLIAPKVILTAAHCVTPVAPVKKHSNWRIFYGTNANFSPLSSYKPVLKAIAHPSWTKLETGKGKDVAVLILSEAAPVAAIPFNTAQVPDSFVKKPAVAVGFGFTSGNQTGLGVKRKATLKITDVSDHELMAQEDGRTICQGDSGGPLFLTSKGVEKIYGVTSYSTSNCTGPGGFVRVDDVMDFIKKHLDANSSPTPPPTGNGNNNNNNAPPPPPPAAPTPPTGPGQACSVSVTCTNGVCSCGAGPNKGKSCDGSTTQGTGSCSAICKSCN